MRPPSSCFPWRAPAPRCRGACTPSTSTSTAPAPRPGARTTCPESDHRPLRSDAWSPVIQCNRRSTSVTARASGATCRQDSPRPQPWSGLARTCVLQSCARSTLPASAFRSPRASSTLSCSSHGTCSNIRARRVSPVAVCRRDLLVRARGCSSRPTGMSAPLPGSWEPSGRPSNVGSPSTGSRRSDGADRSRGQIGAPQRAFQAGGIRAPEHRSTTLRARVSTAFSECCVRCDRSLPPRIERA
jgi:hypothetical protein